MPKPDTATDIICESTQQVEQKIVNVLPEKFNSIVDGWSCRTTHYLAVFASYLGSYGCQERPLLAFSPLLEGEDMSAQSHNAFIAIMLEDKYNCDQSRMSIQSVTTVR